MPPEQVFPSSDVPAVRAGGSESLLKLDPDLGSGMDDDRRRAATRGVIVKLEYHPRGVVADTDALIVNAAFGYLIVSGFLVRGIQLDGRRATELLGPGDLTKFWHTINLDLGASLEDSWSWLTPGSLAVLDRRHLSGPGAFPEIVESLLDREISRSRFLGLQLAACHLPRIDQRLLVTFGYLANRWGTVSSAGIRIPIPINHEMLAGIVAARRPSVTAALGDLDSKGMVTRTDDRCWLADRRILDPASILAKGNEPEPEQVN